MERIYWPFRRPSLRFGHGRAHSNLPERRIWGDRHRVWPPRLDDRRDDNYRGEGRWVEPENHVRIGFERAEIGRSVDLTIARRDCEDQAALTYFSLITMPSRWPS